MKSLKRFISNWKLPAIFVVAAILGVVSLPAQYQPSFMPDSVKEMKINLGLDLQGGSQLDYKIDLSNVAEEDEDQIVEGILDVINERVNKLGVSEPNIYLSNVADERHVIVELAGVKDLEEAKSQVGKTIQLEFKEENDATENDQLDVVRENADKFSVELQNGSEFSVVADLEAKANPTNVYYNVVDTPQFEDNVPGEELLGVLESLEVGEFTTEYIEDALGYTIVDERIVQSEGFVFVKLNSKNETQFEKNLPREVELDTILIPFDEALNSSSDLTALEAATQAAAIIADITNGETTFEEAQAEYNVENADLSESLELAEIKPELSEEGDLYELTVETDYGYVVARAGSITEESTELVDGTEYTYETLVFSTLPDPWKDTELNGAYFERANLAFQNGVTPIVSIQFTAEGAKLFEEITERNIGKRVAIFVGGNLVSSPTVNTKIAGGEAVIQGAFTLDEAEELARDLNTGAIPAPITLAGQYTIGPNLGQAALDASLKAGALGLILLALYMMAYYRVSGLLANVALVIYSVLLVFLIKSSISVALALLIAFGIYCVSLSKIYSSDEKLVEQTLTFIVSTFALFFIWFLLSTPVVLTLAGIAGIILSIGMAVDANVLIFERIKEEIRDGKEYRKAVEEGFARAWSSIRDSNFSSLITCGILYSFGSSIIRGFALNLAAGILISMFTAIIVTRGMLMAVDRFDNKNLRLLIGADKSDKERKTIKFIEKSKIWFAISALLVVASLGSIAVKGLNAGIDFTGGTLMEVQLNDVETDQKDLISEIVMDAVGSEDVNVVSAGENVYQVKTKYIEEETHDMILQNFRNQITTNLEETRFTTVGPTISDALKSKAVIALTLALLAIIAYIALTFRNIPKGFSPWKFGFAAMVALAHDVIITLGVFSIFGLQVDALFITALLTVIGFSVHDTIVVFDRVRENLKGANVKKNGFADVCNKSLTQTLARSINTSVSTLLTLLALLILGDASVFEFVLALVIGIGIGTYSSIFIASPALNKMQER
jgi:SecD/SecF fusion protein